MGDVHDILTTRGKQAALVSGVSREIVEAAAAYMASEENGFGFLYSGWCQSALPHKRIPDDERWKVDGERVSLLVEPGARIEADGSVKTVGVPYGSRARLIMIYLQSEALKNSSPEVELGGSLRQWLKRMGINPGGKDISIVLNQAERISRCRLSFHFPAGTRIGLVNQNIVDTAMFVPGGGNGRRSLFADAVRLSDAFFNELKKHPVPIEDAALQAIANNSQAIDIYCWLAFRLHALTEPRPVSWAALKAQFGAHRVGTPAKFRKSFVVNLRLALAVYPAAKVEETASSLILHPSSPPVPPRTIVTVPRLAIVR